MAALLPLIPSAHASAYAAEDLPGGREDERVAVLGRDNQACRFCSLTTSSGQGVFHLDGDHDNWSRDNLVTACHLCTMVQHLHRPMIEHELAVIWLPETSQAGLNQITRAIHLALHRNGQPAFPKPWLRSGSSDARAAHEAYNALRAQGLEAERRIGSASPRVLAAVLQMMPPEPSAVRANRLGGLRLLHLGRHFQGGRDIYPDILEAWARPASLRGDRPCLAS